MTLRSMIAVLAGYVGARFFGAALGLLTQLVLARLMSPEALATVLVAMSAAALIALVLNGGHTQLAATHLPRLLARSHKGAVDGFHGLVARDTLFGFAVAILVFFAVWFSGILSSAMTCALMAGVACAPWASLARYNSMIANSLRRFELSYLPDFVIRPGLFLAAIAVLALAGWAGHVAAILIAFGLLLAVTAIGQALLLGNAGLKIRHLRLARQRYSAALRPRALALLIVSLASFAFADIVTLVAGFALPDHEAAVAGVAVRLAAVAGFVLQAAQLFALPDYTETAATGEPTKVRAVLWRVNGLTLLVILAGLLAAVFLGRFVLGLFGAVYAGGANLLVLFLVGHSLRALGGMNQHLLAGDGYQSGTAWPCLVALMVLAGSAFVLCRVWGLEGLGYAVIAAELTWLLGLAIMAQRLTGRRADLLWLLQHRT